MKKERDLCVDFIRGIAILLVILGHTVSNNNIVGYENSIIYKVIFSLQMPLFMMISGYVVKYSQPITSIKAFAKYFAKRTMSYLLPWFVWSVFIKGFLFEGWKLNDCFDMFCRLLHNMDSGYWFLFSLWTICVAWGISSLIANRITKNKVGYTFAEIAVSCILAVALMLIAVKFGLAFLNIKLTLYYMPFYYMGYYFSKVYPVLVEKKIYPLAESIAVFLCMSLYVILLVCFNTAVAGDSITEIFLRIVCSVTGCTTTVFVAAGFYNQIITNKITDKIKQLIVSAGKKSLGLYLVHYYFLNTINLEIATLFYSVTGFVTSFINFALTILFSVVAVYIITSNKISSFLLLGATKTGK